MQLACRLCRVRLDAESGCAACDPVRRNLVAVEERDEDRPELSEVGAEAVLVLRRQLRHVGGLLRADPADDRAARQAVTLANAVAKVIESARKLQVDAEGAIRGMSFAQRAKLFVEWYADLPPPYRTQLRDRLDAFEQELLRPVTGDKLLTAPAVPLEAK